MTDEDEKVYQRMHEIRAQITGLLAELPDDSKAALLYTLMLEPGTARELPAVIATSMLHRAEALAQLCQCVECKAKRGNA
jgi:hypothetical protein